MRNWAFERRAMLKGAAAGAGIALALSSGVVRAAGQIVPKPKLPPPIQPAERLQRLARAQELMRANGIGTILIEPGASLDYFSGIQWWRSERLTALVIPAEGAPVVVTPFFEKPSIAEMLQIPAEIRTWNEDEDPLGLVASFIATSKLGTLPVAFEETNRFFILDRLKAVLPSVRAINANPVVRYLRMRKSPAELALMQAANDITLAAQKYAHDNLKAGMAPTEIDAMIAAATTAQGGGYDGGLVLLNEASAYPHGSKQPQVVKKGGVVLLDCGCDVHGYKSDISRTFVFGTPTAQQVKVWDQMREGQDIAWRAAKVAAAAGSVDDAVRSAYTRWGYGPGYALPGTPHRTGHGIGMEGHEPVNLVHGEMTALEPGMCFSNEPGIYIPGQFGIRLEDCFHMGETGPIWFTRPPDRIDQPFA